MPFPVAALLLLLQATDPQEQGLKALEARQYPAAIAAFERAVASDPRDYSAHFHLGLARSMAGQNAEAAAAYRKTLELKPGLYEAQLNLGVVLISLKQPAEAAAVLKDAAAQKPKESTVCVWVMGLPPMKLGPSRDRHGTVGAPAVIGA